MTRKGFSPLDCPCCQSETVAYGKRSLEVLTPWGEASLRVPRRHCRACQTIRQHLPLGLDNSGLSPRSLLRVLDQATRLPFREAQAGLEIQGLPLSLSHVERLTQAYGQVFQEKSETQLRRLAEQPLASSPASRLMVVEGDGTYVRERDKPVKGQHEGRELKHLLFYPYGSPSRRDSYASPVCSDDFLPFAQGLMRHAGVAQNDVLIGIGDGAAWLDELFDSLGVQQRILDVFHAVQYLERLLVYWGWDEKQRLEERCRWFRGEVNAAHRLAELSALHPVTDACPFEVQRDWRYLQRHAQRGEMAYRDFKGKGWPIGSGQIEGANKSVINARMTRGGMFWSHEGIGRMPALRSDQCSFHTLVEFHETRLQAFNPY